MGHYPIFLELVGRSCLVIGGGPVAGRKVDGLLNAGASVTVVSPMLCSSLEALAEDGRIRHVGREYAPGDLAGHQLIFVATDDRRVSAAVIREGRERGVWVNAADDPAGCDFILPAVLRRGALMVAVATGGASPALTRAIREELEAYFTEDYTALAEIVAEVRRELKARARVPDGEAWHRALDADLRRLLAEGKREEAKARLLERLGAR
ncbi:MAG: bifunctional precorrin-2 dehydrogenase/sirohydrochlorin ferrochelatase [Candidatus Rokubacteria bacterium]|nr:bifunctional precorrin-2 dehydrogenase/sirohydrochlorin ferrochelatase [Candidatus Rokubacteria bacterium]